MECYERRSTEKKTHFDEICLVVVLEAYKDMCLAISKALSICMLKPGRRKDGFLILHGHNMDSVSVNEVLSDGSLCPCGIGKVFEQDKPCVVALKMRSKTSCRVTPLVAL